MHQSSRCGDYSEIQDSIHVVHLFGDYVPRSAVLGAVKRLVYTNVRFLVTLV